MGEERESTEQQSKYLLEIVSRFQRITENALHTNYGSQNVFDEEPDLRLATLVANRNAQFSDDFAAQGHVYGFMSHGHDNDSDGQGNIAVASLTSSVPPLAGATDDDDDDEVKDEEEEGISFPSRKLNSCSDIEDIL